MTQKELLYLEDAIMHEINTIKIIDLSIYQIKNKNIINFFKEQRKIHEKIKKRLLGLMEEKSNE